MRVLLPVLALVVPAVAQEARPAVFRDLSYETAQAEAAREGRLLVLDAMTSWCGPCKIMDATTWVAPRVERWFAEHGLALQLDMDEHEELKRSLGIKAFPTIIVFRDATEFDRVVGLRTAPELLTWLENVRAGRREIDGVRAELDAVRAAGSAPFARRARLASALASHGLVEDALEQALILWDAAPDDQALRAAADDWRRGPGRFLARDLATGSRAARMEFLRVRATREAELAAGDERRRDDWIELNFVLGDESPTVAWAVALSAAEKTRAALKRRERRLFDLLVDAGHWAAAGHALNDAVAEVEWRGRTLGAYDVQSGPAPLDTPGDGARPASVPAVPLVAPGGSADEPPDVVPAIPLTRPAGDDAPVPAVPLVAPAGGDRGQAIPAVPMIPMQAPETEPRAAVPMVPMAGAPAARPESPEDVAREVRARLTAELRRVAARRYGALLAAARDDEAALVAETLLRYADDSGARAGLVADALRAGHFDAARERHLAWLDQITFAR